MVDLGEIQVLIRIILEEVERFFRGELSSLDSPEDVFKLRFHGRILS
jgi:hypothetical protein